MLMAIDIGNTNSVFALYEGAASIRQWRLSTNSVRTADEYAVWLSQLMAMTGRELREISDCIIATVVPPAAIPLVDQLFLRNPALRGNAFDRHRRFDQPRHDRVGPNAVARVGDGQRVRQRIQARFRHLVGRQVDRRGHRRDRRNVRDRARLLPPHDRQGVLARQERAFQVDAHNAVPRLDIHG